MFASAFYLVGSTELPDDFLPFGAGPAFTTAALVSTSYLGFAQIATVGRAVPRGGRGRQPAARDPHVDALERVAAEQHVDAILVPTALGGAETGQILVPVRGEPNADRIARFVTAVADEVGAGLIVLGETEPGDPEVVLGRLPRNVARRTQRPVIVVRSAGEGEDETG